METEELETIDDLLFTGFNEGIRFMLQNPNIVIESAEQIRKAYEKQMLKLFEEKKKREAQ
jgi:hypothetical protein